MSAAKFQPVLNTQISERLEVSSKNLQTRLPGLPDGILSNQKSQFG
jgi:hypothetical protein